MSLWSPPHIDRTLIVVSSRRQCETVHQFLQGEGVAAGALAHERPKRADKEATLGAFASATTRALVID